MGVFVLGHDWVGERDLSRFTCTIRDNGVAAMTNLREVEELLGKLSSAEKAQVLKWVVQDLGDGFPGVDSRPEVCGGEACIVRTRIPVWILEKARRMGISEQLLLAGYPSLLAEDLVNAWNYARSHAAEMEQQIRENESA